MTLEPEMALHMVMVLHELPTNAENYGAVGYERPGHRAMGRKGLGAAARVGRVVELGS